MKRITIAGLVLGAALTSQVNAAIMLDTDCSSTGGSLDVTISSGSAASCWSGTGIPLTPPLEDFSDGVNTWTHGESLSTSFASDASYTYTATTSIDGLGLSATGAGGSTGQWSINADLGYESYLVVLNASQDESEGSVWAAYLFEDNGSAEDTGAWLSSFSSGINSISLYVQLDSNTTTPAPVPEPSGLALFGLGLLGLRLTRRGKRGVVAK